MDLGIFNQSKADLMLYQMRLTNGGIDPISSGTFVRADGSSLALTSADFQMTPETFWKSEKTKANYPIGWRIALPKEQLAFTLRPLIPNQELALDPLIYWEGAFALEGTRGGKPIHGRGYLELTGYAGALGSSIDAAGCGALGILPVRQQASRLLRSADAQARCLLSPQPGQLCCLSGPCAPHDGERFRPRWRRRGRSVYALLWCSCAHGSHAALVPVLGSL